MSIHTHATSDNPQSAHDHGDDLRTYFLVFGSLVILLFCTWGAYHIPFEHYHIGEHNLGWVNTAVALLIASFKASLVVLIFMHLRHSTKLTWVVATAGFVWLCVMILFTFADYLSRNTIMESVRDTPYQVQAGTHANGTVLAKEPEKDYDSTPGW